MLDAGAYQAFWGLYDASGVRPEYLIPVLAFESGLNPAASNGAGAPYYGLGQNYGPSLPVDPATYITWSASQQITQVITPYFQSIVSKYGGLHSGIRVYQAEFYPASLVYARGLGSKIVSAPSSAYTDNAAAFDKAGKGYITPGDLAVAVKKMIAQPYVRDAIARTYALRPWEIEQDPVYGTDFGDPIATLLIAAGVLGAAGWIAYKVDPSVLPAWAQRGYSKLARVF